MSDKLHSSQNQQQSQMKKEEKKEEKRRRAGIWWWGTGVGLVVLAGLIVGGLYGTGYIGKRLADKSKLDNAFVFRIDGKDKQGHNAAFDFMVLTDEYTWVKGSATQVTSRGQVVPESEVAQRVISTQIGQSLNRATDLIAVGLASHEGEKREEEARADQRSKTIAGWMQKLGNPATPIYELNLGQYNKTCKKQEDADTSFERPLILVGVRTKDNGVNLQEALGDAISGRENLPSQDCYTRFDLSKIR